MSDKNKNTAAEAVAVLQQDYDAKLALLNGLEETAMPEAKAEAQTAVDEAKELLDKATSPKASTAPKAEKEKYLKGVFVVSPTGKYSLAYNVGESASLPELQALELEEAGYFKLDK